MVVVSMLHAEKRGLDVSSGTFNGGQNLPIHATSSSDLLERILGDIANQVCQDGTAKTMFVTEDSRIEQRPCPHTDIIQ